MTETIERVMVITAHPDDSEFGAGGTVAKLTREGKTVTYCVVTNGDKGSSDRSMTPERLVTIREELAARHVVRNLADLKTRVAIWERGDASSRGIAQEKAERLVIVIEAISCQGLAQNRGGLIGGGPTEPGTGDATEQTRELNSVAPWRCPHEEA